MLAGDPACLGALPIIFSHRLHLRRPVCWSGRGAPCQGCQERRRWPCCAKPSRRFPWAAIAIGKLEGMLNPTGRRRLAKSVVAKDDGLLRSTATPSLLPFDDVSGEFIDVGARYALSVAGWHPSTGGLPLVALATTGALEIRAVGARRGPVVRRARCEAQRQ
jgi:hypothetical protein